MKKRMITASVILALLLFLAGGVWFFHSHYLILEGRIISRDAEVLDLSGKPLQDLRRLPELKYLRQLDLRDTQITVEEYDYLQASLPGCEIQWLLPFQDTYLPIDTRHITLTELEESEIPLLAYLPQLESVDANGCRDYDALMALRKQYPGCSISYRLTLGDTVLDQDSTGYTGSDIASISTALTYLPKLTSIDAEGCSDYAALMALQAQYPHCHIAYEVPLGGTDWPEDSTAIRVHSVSAQALSGAVPYLPKLQEVFVEAPITDTDTLLALALAYPDIRFNCQFTLLGKTVSSEDPQLDISGIALNSTDQIEAYLPLFHQLQTVDMCGCGIANEEMAALNERNPDTLFVWEVQMGNFTLRTDITYFMPYQYRYQVTDADADTLCYLTELICLDFGHMDISRTDYLAHMPKMQYLLMCDTKITDLSPCAGMKELKYAELFMTPVTDFSPLLECENLVDLNVCYTYPEDPLIFGKMTQLQNLWYRGMMDEQIKAQLRQALPNTRILFGPGSSTGRGWRELPNYYAQRDILGMPYMTD